MSGSEDVTNQLIARAKSGDKSACDELLRHHRDRLKRMLMMRMDPRVRARFDPSDVIQEALLTASRRLASYLEDPQIPFYPWLRKIAWEHLLKLHEHHLKVEKRTVSKEVRLDVAINDESAHQLADLLATSLTSPSLRLVRDEMCSRIRDALKALREKDREVLELLYLEQLNSSEVASILEVTQAVVRTRHCRAIQRLSLMLERP